ncbi:hypothetical protein P3T16_004542 [Paraburkholderia sp. GAS42]|jgi:hypothetical protein
MTFRYIAVLAAGALLALSPLANAFDATGVAIIPHLT